MHKLPHIQKCMNRHINIYNHITHGKMLESKLVITGTLLYTANEMHFRIANVIYFYIQRLINRAQILKEKQKTKGGF